MDQIAYQPRGRNPFYKKSYIINLNFRSSILKNLRITLSASFLLFVLIGSFSFSSDVCKLSFLSFLNNHKPTDRRHLEHSNKLLPCLNKYSND